MGKDCKQLCALNLNRGYIILEYGLSFARRVVKCGRSVEIEVN